MKQKLLYIIMCLICTFAWSGEVWGQCTVIEKTDFNSYTSYSDNNIKNNLSDGKFKNTTNHVTFELYGDNSLEYDGTLKLHFGGVNKNGKNFYYKWTPADNYSVRVTKLEMNIRGYGTGSKAKAALNNGTTTTNCGSLIVDWTSLSTENTSGLPNPVRLYTVTTTNDNRSFYTNVFTFTYKVTHNELDLQYLDAAITSANELSVPNDMNSKLRGYLNTAVSDNKTGRSEFLFPTYITGKKKPADVDEATNRVKAVTAFVKSLNTAWGIDKTKVPEDVANLLDDYDNWDPNISSHETSDINTATRNLNKAIAIAGKVSQKYLDAKTELQSKQALSNSNNPSGVANSDISNAYAELEHDTTVTAINTTLGKIKNFDAVNFNSNIPSTLYTGKTYSNVASASSGRTLSYSYSVASVVSVSETTLTAENPGTVMVTATTGSTAEGYYKCEKTQTYTVLPVFYFSADVTSSNKDLGTVSVEYGNEFVEDINVSRKEETATYTAAPKNDCVFLGWYTNSDYSGEPVSLSTTYSQTKINDAYGTTVEFTPLYALFKKKQNLQWVDDGHNISVILGTTGLSSVASITSGEGHTINYASTNEAALTIDANGAITTHSIGSGTITASVAGDNIYRAESISREFTVGEKDNPLFTPSWWTELDKPTNTDIKVGTSTTVSLENVASAADPSFKVSVIPVDPADRNILSWERQGNVLTILGDEAGQAKIKIEQEETTTINPNSAIYTINVSKYPNNFAVDAIVKEIVAGNVWNNVVTAWGLGADRTQVTSSDSDIATYDVATNTITAVGFGVATITFHQDATSDTEGANIDVTVSVTRKANNMSISLPYQQALVGGTIELNVSGKDNPSNIEGIITDTHLSSNVNDGTEVISFDSDTKKIIALNAGTAKIKFSQDATPEYAAYINNATYEITVNKISNSIVVKLDNEQKNSINVARNTPVSLAYYSSSSSNGTLHINRTSGSDAIATLSGNTITAGETDGVNVWTITQDETYMYEAASTSFRIKVNSEAEADSYIHTSYADGNNYSWNTGGGNDYSISVNYMPSKILFNAWHTDGLIFPGVNESITVRWKDANGNELGSKKFDITSNSTQYEVADLPEEARQFSFSATGSYTQHVSDVYVVRKTYINASCNKSDLGTIYTDQTATATISVEWGSSNGGDIAIEEMNNNPRFSFSPNPITGTANSNGSRDVIVTYTPDPDVLSQEEATIIVSDKFYRKEVKIKAAAQKYPTTIERGNNVETTISVYDIINNVFEFAGTSTAYPSNDAEDEFYYTISHTPSSVEVISYDPEHNTITGLNGGSATLTIYQKNTNLYHATSRSFNFTVNKLANNVGISLSKTTLSVDDNVTVSLTNDVSEGELSAIISNETYLNASQNRDGGLLSFDSGTNKLIGMNAGTATVTITQNETSKYMAKSQQFTITVNKLSQTLAWKNANLETTMQKGSILSGNTATSDVGLTPIIYSSSNEASITVNEATGELTALATGTSDITASQAGNYKYLPATLTRQFSVFNKQTPAFAADANFTGANGSVEYTGTAIITVTGVGADSEQGFTITNGDNSIINVVRNGETITITGLKLGSTTLTLTQTGNDDFIAKSQTYNIEVYMPDDFLALSPATVPSHEEGIYRKVFLNNTLKSGYSTIALPFNTTVETLTGRAANANDWVAQLSVVTYNAKDGYSLYFSKSNTIVANQPYILHLGTAVESPVFTDVSVVAAATATQNATMGVGYNDWIMHSNYNPAFNMNGYYGVVGEQIKKGTTGSTLKAFHAYITGPAAAGVKAAYLEEDEADGILELLKGEETEPENIYDLQGRQLPRAGKGINIIRNADGTVRKVLTPNR